MDIGRQRIIPPPSGGLVSETILVMGGYFNPFRLWGIIPLWARLFIHRRLPLMPTQIEGREGIEAIREKIREMN